MINFLISNTNRSLEYVKHVIENKKIEIGFVLLYTKEKNPKIIILLKKLKNDLKIYHIKLNDIDKIKIKKYLKINNYKYVVSCYPGEIVRNNELLKLKLIHCHPGDLPPFGGSTTIYYGLILKNKICVTIFEMNKYIDRGKILFKKFFTKPRDIQTIENKYVDKIRAKALCSYLNLKKINKLDKFKKYKKNKYMNYYIAHPVIRNIVLNKNIFKSNKLF